jgi:hypothetical protein
MDIRKCCDLLDLPPGYSQADLKQAYKDLVQVWHPDRFAHNARLKEKAEAKLKQINLAYEVLDRALIMRAKLQAARGQQSDDSSESLEAQIVRAVYERSMSWGRPSGQQWRLQLSMLLWSVGIFVVCLMALGLLAAISHNPMLFVALLIVVGSYFGLRWLHERG